MGNGSKADSDRYVNKHIAGWKKRLDPMLVQCKALLELRDKRSYKQADVIEYLMKGFLEESGHTICEIKKH